MGGILLSFFFWPVFRCELLVSRRVAWLNKPCDFGGFWGYLLGFLGAENYIIKSLATRFFRFSQGSNMLTATDGSGGGFTPLICEDGPTFTARWCLVKIPKQKLGDVWTPQFLQRNRNLRNSQFGFLHLRMDGFPCWPESFFQNQQPNKFKLR